MKHIVRSSLFLSLTLLVSACGAVNQSIEIGDGSVVNNDLSSVNGSITIGENATVNGELSNINGGIRVGAGSTAGDISTVNGAINLAEGSVTGSVGTVNGPINLGDGVRVNGGATTVNGSISADQRVVIVGDLAAVNGRLSLDAESRVAGHASTINGTLTLINAYVQSASTVSGSMDILEGSTIDGELRVEKPQRSRNQDGIPRIVIGENSSVVGPLVFEREVELHVHETAQIGEISGAEPRIFSGSEP